MSIKGTKVGPMRCRPEARAAFIELFGERAVSEARFVIRQWRRIRWLEILPEGRRKVGDSSVSWTRMRGAGDLRVQHSAPTAIDYTLTWEVISWRRTRVAEVRLTRQ